MPSASDVQKNFGLWHDRLHEGPVEVTRYGRTTAFLVSARQFEELWSSYRRALSANALSDDDMALIATSRVETDQPFVLDDLPDDDDQTRPRSER